MYMKTLKEQVEEIYSNIRFEDFRLYDNSFNVVNM